MGKIKIIKILCTVLCVILTMILSFAACTNNENSPAAPNQSWQPVNPNNPDQYQQNEPSTQNPTSVQAQNDYNKPADQSLKLPLIVKNTTFNQYFVINNNGTAEGIDNSTKGISVDNVRSLLSVQTHVQEGFSLIPLYTHFFIKTDNTLWAFGSNYNGILGDNTGVDREVTWEFSDDGGIIQSIVPVKILDDVANIYFSNYSVVCAIKNDKSLWKWGGGVFEPKKIADSVIDVLENLLFYDLGGLGHSYDLGGGGVFDLTKYDSLGLSYFTDDGYIVNTTGISFQSVRIKQNFTLRADGELWSIENSFWSLHDLPSSIKGFPREYGFFTNNIKDWYSYRSGWDMGVLVLKNNGILLGWGENSAGQLGDSTKIDRNETFVHIADDVKTMGSYWYLKNDGTLWTWDSFNPTPAQTDDHIQEVYSSYFGTFFLKDNGMLINGSVEFSDFTVSEFIVNRFAYGSEAGFWTTFVIDTNGNLYRMGKASDDIWSSPTLGFTLVTEDIKMPNEYIVNN